MKASPQSVTTVKSIALVEKKEAEVRICRFQKNQLKSAHCGSKSVLSASQKNEQSECYSQSYTKISLNPRIALANPFYPRPKK